MNDACYTNKNNFDVIETREGEHETNEKTAENELKKMQKYLCVPCVSTQSKQLRQLKQVRGGPGGADGKGTLVHLKH